TSNATPWELVSRNGVYLYQCMFVPGLTMLVTGGTEMLSAEMRLVTPLVAVKILFGNGIRFRFRFTVSVKLFVTVGLLLRTPRKYWPPGMSGAPSGLLV